MGLLARASDLWRYFRGGNGDPSAVAQHDSPRQQKLRAQKQAFKDLFGRDMQAGDQFAIPQVLTEEAIYSGGWHTYWHEIYDEAMRNSRKNALAMANDEWIMACLWERIRAVTSLKWHLEVEDDSDPWQVLVRDAVTKSIERTYRLRRLFRHLDWALWPGRYGAQCLWEWDRVEIETPRGREECKVLRLAYHLPLNGDKIGYKLDHTPYVLVWGGSDDALGDADVIWTTKAKAVALTGTWRNRFLIHQVNVMDADFEQADRADMIHGVGIRNWLYWSWWLKNEYVTAVIRSMDKLGLGFVTIEYDAANPDAKQEALDAGKNLSVNRSVLVVPMSPKSGAQGAVKVVETPVSGAQVLLQLQEACEKREERFIIAQTGSASSETTGMGTHDQSFTQDTKYQLIEEDAWELGETLTGSEREPGLASIIKKHSFPWADFPLYFKFDVDAPDPERKLGAATMFFNLGGRLKEDEVREVTGFSAPGPDDAVLINPQIAQANQQAQQGDPNAPPPAPGGDPSGGGQPPAPGGAPPGGAAPPSDPVFAQLLQGQQPVKPPQPQHFGREGAERYDQSGAPTAQKPPQKPPAVKAPPKVTPAPAPTTPHISAPSVSTPPPSVDPAKLPPPSPPFSQAPTVRPLPPAAPRPSDPFSPEFVQKFNADLARRQPPQPATEITGAAAAQARPPFSPEYVKDFNARLKAREQAPAEASPTPAQPAQHEALAGAVGKAFPGVAPSQSGYALPLGSDREINAALDPQDGHVGLDLRNTGQILRPAQPGQLHPGSVDAGRKMVGLVRQLAEAGLPVKFGTTTRKAQVYAKLLGRLGFTRTEQSAGTPGFSREWWSAPQKDGTQPAAQYAAETPDEEPLLTDEEWEILFGDDEAEQYAKPTGVTQPATPRATAVPAPPKVAATAPAPAPAPAKPTTTDSKQFQPTLKEAAKGDLTGFHDRMALPATQAAWAAARAAAAPAPPAAAAPRPGIAVPAPPSQGAPPAPPHSEATQKTKSAIESVFPGQQPQRYGNSLSYRINVAGDRQIHLQVDEHGVAAINFSNAAAAAQAGLGDWGVGKELRGGTVELRNTLTSLLKSLAAAGTPVRFGALKRAEGEKSTTENRRDRVYGKLLTKLGWTQEYSVDGGNVQAQRWHPPAKQEPAAAQYAAESDDDDLLTPEEWEILFGDDEEESPERYAKPVPPEEPVQPVETPTPKAEPKSAPTPPPPAPPHEVKPAELLPETPPHEVQPKELLPKDEPVGTPEGAPAPAAAPDPSTLPRGRQLFRQARQIGAAVLATGSAALDKLPGAKYLRQKTADMVQRLEARYGRKQARAIVAAGQVLSWAATAGANAAGIPLPPIPGSSVVFYAPLVALAELHHQLNKLRRGAPQQHARDSLTGERLQGALQEFLAELRDLRDGGAEEYARKEAAATKADSDMMGALAKISEALAQPAPAPVINITQPPVTVNIEPAQVTVPAAHITVESPTVNVQPANVIVEPAEVTVNLPAPGTVRHTVERDADGNITGTLVEPVKK